MDFLGNELGGFACNRQWNLRLHEHQIWEEWHDSWSVGVIVVLLLLCTCLCLFVLVLGQLKELMQQGDQQLESSLTMATSKIRGSASYWHMTFQDLELMDSIFGLCLLRLYKSCENMSGCLKVFKSKTII